MIDERLGLEQKPGSRFAPRVCAGSIGGVMVFGGLVFFLASGHGAPMYATPTSPRVIQPNMNVEATHGAEYAAAAGRNDKVIHPRDGSASMGERKPNNLMPRTPRPGQAVPPCPGSTSTLHGACWYRTAFKPPCPPDQVQEGENCYVAVGEREKQPTSETRELPHPAGD